MSTVKLVTQVAEKDGDQHSEQPISIGVLARDVVDLRPNQPGYTEDTANQTGWTLAQLIDNYRDYMREVPFIFIGYPKEDDGTGIKNNHVGLWIDTSVTSRTQWDTR